MKGWNEAYGYRCKKLSSYSKFLQIKQRSIISLVSCPNFFNKNKSDTLFVLVLSDRVEEYLRKRDAAGYDSRADRSVRMKAYRWMAAQAKPHLTREGAVLMDLRCFDAYIKFHKYDPFFKKKRLLLLVNRHVKTFDERVA